jgi:hypothetical protein
MSHFYLIGRGAVEGSSVGPLARIASVRAVVELSKIINAGDNAGVDNGHTVGDDKQAVLICHYS